MTPRRRDLAGFAALAAVAGPLTGCAADSQPGLEAEARRLAPAGASVAGALTNLRRTGFACRAPAGDAKVACERVLSHDGIATCVQHVILQADSTSGRVIRVDALRPACAGF